MAFPRTTGSARCIGRFATVRLSTISNGCSTAGRTYCWRIRTEPPRWRRPRARAADVLELVERRGITIALEGDDAFLGACTRANEAEARKLVAADPSLVARMQAQSPGELADFAGTENVRAVRLMLDLGFDPGTARTQPSWAAGETALHVATAHGRQQIVELLIERGAPLEAKRHRGGWTPLRVAFVCLEQQSEWTPNDYTLPIAEALIRAGASVQDAGLTLTAAVCLERSEDVARLALQAGSEERQKALAAAAYNGRPDAIATAIALGADPNSPNIGLHPHATALHNAVCSGSLAAVQQLVESGARTDIQDGAYQATPLIWAEYFVRESAADKVEYFQREGTRPKQYAQIAAYLRDRQGISQP
jgi:ankyrin repeat protein